MYMCLRGTREREMALPLLLILVLYLWFLSSSAAAAAGDDQDLLNTIYPDCEKRCGNVTVKYPFGIGDPFGDGEPRCSRSKQFTIRCEDGKKAMLHTENGKVEVMNISLELGQIWIRSPLGAQCPNRSDISNTVPYMFLGDLYTFSSTRNKFTAIGCNLQGYVEGRTTSDNYFRAGCLAFCSNGTKADESCTGSGCCQSTIPEGLRWIEGHSRPYEGVGNVASSNSCVYLFLADQDQFKFSASDLMGTNFLEKGRSMQAVVDWVAGTETCENITYLTNTDKNACRSSNSNCYNSATGRGYLCNCSMGYQGNPYLAGGCQDIKECEDKENNPCVETATCEETAGRYRCNCPEGTHGDGEKDGDGCIDDAKELPILKIVLGTGLGFLFLLIGSTWTYWLWRKRRTMKLKEKFFQQNGGMLLQQKISSHTAKAFRIFTVKELEKATDNYSTSNVVGQGGYGVVYKGVLPDNRVVAIKKSKSADANQTEQFINEVDILSQINHRNVVKLLGCCLEAEVPLLVYEFVSNGTLSEHIHNVVNMPSMSLQDRLRIAEETADALAYLHSAASMPIFHRDVKCANILLDNNYTAKVSDFGASRLVSIEQTQITTLVQGTLGYLDPEYFQTGQLTAKSDVYSFGVVLAELLTGQRPVCFSRPEGERNLAMHFLLAMKENRLFQVLDDRVLNEGQVEQLTAIARLVKQCLRLKGEERPTMKEVVVELQGLRGLYDHPWVNCNIEENDSLLVKNPDTALMIPNRWESL